MIFLLSDVGMLYAFQPDMTSGDQKGHHVNIRITKMIYDP